MRRPVIGIRGGIRLLQIRLAHSVELGALDGFPDGLSHELGALPFRGRRDLIQRLISCVVELDQY